MISLSPPIKPAAHARLPVGTRSSEKLGGRPRDANMPPRHPLSFVCTPEIASLLCVFHRIPAALLDVAMTKSDRFEFCRGII